MATLGATPYSGVRTRDVGVRVMRGLRLPQTGYMSDDLYQVYHIVIVNIIVIVDITVIVTTSTIPGHALLLDV